MTLQELLDLLAAGDKDALAAALSGDVDLSALETEALELFDGIRAGDVVGDDEMATLEALADGVEALRAEGGRREQAAAETRARVDEIAARVNPEAEGETEGETGQADDDQAATGQGADATVEAVEQDAELVTASAGKPAMGARRVDLAAVAKRAAPAKPPASVTPKGYSLVAAGDAPGMTVGSHFADWSAITDAFMRRYDAMPTPGTYDGRVEHQVLKINLDYPQELVASGRDSDMDVLAYAVDQSRLPGESLLAAGGWCAPSEILYDLCEREDTTGMLSIPEVTMGRGGIRFTMGPDFSEIFSHAGYFLQTEAQAIAGTTKPCFEVPCPDFEECRLDVMGICLTAGILQRRGYPEVIERFIRGTLAAHLHRYNGETIRRMAVGSTLVSLPGTPFSATVDLLGSIELQVWDYRYKHRMDDEATLELVAPMWLKGVIRADIAKRNAWDNPLTVTDAMILEWFRSRGVSVQFVYDWQDAYFPGPIQGGDPGTMGGAVAPTVWPDSVDLLLYAPGVWVRGTADVIEIGTLYDSALLRQNKYNAIFSEQGIQVCQRCWDARLLRIPICPTGYSADQVAVACPSL